MIIVVSGNNLRNSLAAARRALGVKLRDSRVITESGGDDGLYRVTLATGDVVEVTLVQHARCQVQQIVRE